MIITNYKKIACNNARADALQIAEAGYKSIEIDQLFNSFVEQKRYLRIKNHEYDFSKYNKIFVIGFGKGSALAIKTLTKQLPSSQIHGGVVIDIHKYRQLSKIKSYLGTHPLPTNQNIDATSYLIKLLSQAGSNDLVLCVVCGGGSSLLCQPSGDFTCIDLAEIGDFLLKSGADINQINTVRKHISKIHGGYLAHYAYPATVVSLVISDVVGDDLSIIASGPTHFDSSTIADAKQVASKFGLQNMNFNETPKDKKIFEKVENYIIASGKIVVDAMQNKAIGLGYLPKIYSDKLTGMAKDVGPLMAKSVKPGDALLACGETQVKVLHKGKGGRNQDVALSGLESLSPASVIVSCASDGRDNVNNVAGAITDGTFAKLKAKKLGIDPKESVKNNQSYASLKKLNGLFSTSEVTANISDFIVVTNKRV